MNKILVSIAMFLLGLIATQQCPAQITYTSSTITINGDNGDNQVLISKLRFGQLRVALLNGDGVWERETIYGRWSNMLIKCDLGRGSNHFWNSTSLQAIIEVDGNGFNSIFCGDGNDFFVSNGNSRDFVYGGGGGDWLNPGDGGDWVIGGEGNDTVVDSFLGFSFRSGDGNVDWLWGGEGRDTFYAGTEDQIRDQSPGESVYRR